MGRTPLCAAPGLRMVQTRSRNRRLISAVGALLAASQATQPAWAWGRTGHRVIAKLAVRHLTGEARAEIKALLEPGESLADASTWADEIRGRMRHTAPGHYVDVPLDEPRYDDKFAGDTPEKGFIVPKIRELRLVLKDRSRPVEARRQALRFLVHFVEDLHMLLHVGENHDKGGNNLQVRCFDRGSNLHHVWDSGIIDHTGWGEDGWLADLIAKDTHEARERAS